MKDHQTFAGPTKLPTSIISSGPRVDSVWDIYYGLQGTWTKQMQQGTVSDEGLFSDFQDNLIDKYKQIDTP